MPTILRKGPYRFFFYAADRNEPVHAHIERDDKVAKFWLEPIRLHTSGGFSRTEIGRIQELVRTHANELKKRDMRISTVEAEMPVTENVTVTEDTLSVDLSDGRTISVPLAWFPRLMHGTRKERDNWRLIGKGYGIHWGDLDEDISVENLLLGQASGESQSSFKKWLSSRQSRLTTSSKRPR